MAKRKIAATTGEDLARALQSTFEHQPEPTNDEPPLALNLLTAISTGNALACDYQAQQAALAQPISENWLGSVQPKGWTSGSAGIYWGCHAIHWVPLDPQKESAWFWSVAVGVNPRTWCPILKLRDRGEAMTVLGLLAGRKLEGKRDGN